MYNTNSIHITIVLDTIRALSEGSLSKSLFLIDDSPFGSKEQGSCSLQTACGPGCRIRWSVIPVDLQTEASIREISFLYAVGDTAVDDAVIPNLRAKTWEGVVPYVAPGNYGYRISLQLGYGKRSVMDICTPLLQVLSPSGYVESLKMRDNE